MDRRMRHRLILAKPCPIATPALFLDRDGVIIKDKHYLSCPNQVELYPGAKEVIFSAKQKGWPVVVVTNQSGIARGLFKWKDYEEVTNRLLSLLGTVDSLAAIYANGYGPDSRSSSWRKPSPKMLEEAALDLNLDLPHSLLIGDRLSDLQAGASAGLCWIAHVATGHGARERTQVKRWKQENVDPDKDSNRTEIRLLDSIADFPYEKLVKAYGCAR
jgi:D-glycero-D-manno-heptose 1,7-bisphosphate phosphatase